MNRTNLRITSVDASHIGELIRIGEQTNLSPWCAQGYLDEMKNPAAILLRLVDEENATIGFVVGRIIAGTYINERPDAEIYNIAVTEDNQREGCGQQLLDAFIKKCRKHNVINIWLEVRESNKKAINFYEKNGFKAVRKRPYFYRNPIEHAFVMRLLLKYDPT